MQSRQENVRDIASTACGRVAIRSRRGKDSGFILTLELLLLMSIFGTVIYFGFQLYQQWLVNQIDPFGGSKAIVYTGQNPANMIGATRSFNQFEAPQFIYRPGATDGPNSIDVANNLAIATDGSIGAVLGVRGGANSHFTSRTRVYYANGDTTCSGAGFLLDPNNATYGSYAAVVSLTFNEQEPVGDFYALQGTAFGIGQAGASNNVLFKGTATTAVFAPGSYWSSESYPAGCVDLPALAASVGGVVQVGNFVTTVSQDLDLVWPPGVGYWSPALSGPAPVMGPPVPGNLTTISATQEGAGVLGPLPGPGVQPSGTEGQP